MAVKGTSQDRWKKKTWFEVIAPKLFEEAKVGNVVASEPEELIGRRVEPSMFELIGDVRKSHMKLVLEIDNVEGTKAITKVTSFELVRSYINSLVRRRTSKVDCIVGGLTQDGIKARIKVFAVTSQRCDTSQKQKIRRIMIAALRKLIAETSFETLLSDTITNKVQKTLKDEVKKIYPIKSVEVRMLQIVPEAEDRRREAKKKRYAERVAAIKAQQKKEEAKVEAAEAPVKEQL